MKLGKIYFVIVCETITEWCTSDDQQAYASSLQTEYRITVYA